MLSITDFKEKQLLFVFLKDGEKISFSNDNIVIKDKVGKVKHQSTCYKLFAIFIIGNFTVTTGILQRSKKFGFSIIFMTTSLRVYEKFPSGMEGNTVLRRMQYLYDKEEIAQHIVYNKILNQKDLLKEVRKKTEPQKESIQLLNGYCDSVKSVLQTRSHLLGIEGNAAKLYFSNYFDNVQWRGRKPRVKHDMVNAALDIGYTILFNTIEAILEVFGFDVYAGVLHKEFYMRKSLVCDIVEPFRVIIDRQVKKSINLSQFTETDFTIYKGKYMLKIQENPKYVSIFAKAIIEEKQRIFLYVQSYYRAFMRNKPIEEYPLYKIGDKNVDN